MTTQLPLLSIITSIYNGGDDILRFLKAISNQTYKNIELIIMEDCSTDTRTLEIVEQLKNKKIEMPMSYTFIQNEKNLGAVYSFQEGLKYAHGEYFTFPQTDDYMDNDFYEVMMNKVIEKNYDAITGLLLCEVEKDVSIKSEEILKDTTISLLDNIRLPLEIRNHTGQILSLFMPDITYCWFHVFSKKLLLHDSDNLNFLNAVKYSISETLYKNYKTGKISLMTPSFYYHKSHKPFNNGGIYNKTTKDYKNALNVEKFILNEMLDNYNKALKVND